MFLGQYSKGSSQPNRQLFACLGGQRRDQGYNRRYNRRFHKEYLSLPKLSPGMFTPCYDKVEWGGECKKGPLYSCAKANAHLGPPHRVIVLFTIMTNSKWKSDQAFPHIRGISSYLLDMEQDVKENLLNGTQMAKTNLARVKNKFVCFFALITISSVWQPSLQVFSEEWAAVAGFTVCVVTASFSTSQVQVIFLFKFKVYVNGKSLAGKLLLHVLRFF